MGHKNNEGMIGWLQILREILFNEIVPEVQIFSATRLGGTCFFLLETFFFILK